MSDEVDSAQQLARAGMKRSRVQRRASYLDYKSVLRRDFWFSCAYCSITELEMGGLEGQVDHYDPTLTDRSDYSNLFWSCSACNRSKSGVWFRDDLRDAGHRVIRIDEEHPGDHFELVGHLLVGRTQVGKTSINVVRLNRKPLRDLRTARAKLNVGSKMVMEGVRTLMGANLDHLPVHSRRALLAMRTRLSREVDTVCADILDLIRVVAASPNLDEDPGANVDRRARKEYLNEVAALGEDSTSMRRLERHLQPARPRRRRKHMERAARKQRKKKSKRGHG